MDTLTPTEIAAAERWVARKYGLSVAEAKAMVARPDHGKAAEDQLAAWQEAHGYAFASDSPLARGFLREALR